MINRIENKVIHDTGTKIKSDQEGVNLKSKKNFNKLLKQKIIPNTDIIETSFNDC